MSTRISPAPLAQPIGGALLPLEWQSWFSQLQNNLQRGFIDGGGHANTIPKFTSAQTLGDSDITDDGTTVGIDADLGVTGDAEVEGDLFVDGSGQVDVNFNVDGNLTAGNSTAINAIDGVTSMTGPAYPGSFPLGLYYYQTALNTTHTISNIQYDSNFFNYSFISTGLQVTKLASTSNPAKLPKFQIQTPSLPVVGDRWSFQMTIDAWANLNTGVEFLLYNFRALSIDNDATTPFNGQVLFPTATAINIGRAWAAGDLIRCDFTVGSSAGNMTLLRSVFLNGNLLSTFTETLSGFATYTDLTALSNCFEAFSGNSNVTSSLFNSISNVLVVGPNSSLGTATQGPTLTVNGDSDFDDIIGGTWKAGTIQVGFGGTGATALAVNGVLYGGGSTAISALAVNSSATAAFLSQTSSAAPAWVSSIGTGVVMLQASPTTTGTLTAAAINMSGNLAIATTKFTVAAASGNTLAAGTFDVTGNFNVNTNKFSVVASSGNTTVAGTVTLNGGNLILGTNSITMTGSLAATGARVTKGWFTDIESTNAATIGGVAATGSGGYVLATSPTITTAVLGSSTATTQSPGDSSTKLATTAYVDAAVFAEGIAKEACKYATTTALPTVIYANGSSGVGATLTASAFGALSFDGSTPSIGDRILIKNQASDFQNGIYTVTVVGAIATLFVLTRATDFDLSSKIRTGDWLFVTSGSTLGATNWTYNGIDSPTMGTTSLTFAQTGGPGYITGGNGITVTGTSVEINTAVTVDLNTIQTLTNKTLTSPILTTPALGTPSSGNLASCTAYAVANLTGTTLPAAIVTSSLTSVGTIGTGVWNGTKVSEVYGGTNQSTYTTGDILYASGSNTLSKLPLGSAGKVLSVNAGGTQIEWGVAGTGTVTTVSVVTANGVSGSVATATTTPAITLTLGAITPSSVTVSGRVNINGATDTTFSALNVLDSPICVGKGAGSGGSVYVFGVGQASDVAAGDVSYIRITHDGTNAILQSGKSGSGGVAKDLLVKTGSGATTAITVSATTQAVTFAAAVTASTTLVVTGVATFNGGLNVTSTAGTFYEEDTWTATLTGCTTSPTVTARFVRTGNKVTLYIPSVTGTSNSTACTITGMPSSIRPARTMQPVVAEVEDAGVFMGGSFSIATSGVITLTRQKDFTTGQTGTFTNSATTKGLSSAAIVSYILT
jgi:hypothetical protein